MDTARLIFLFRATMDANQRQQAEEEISRGHKLPMFTPSLLQVVLLNDLDIAVRQAAAIYLKREIEAHWGPRDVEWDHPVSFIIDDEDKSVIRDSIVEAVVQAPPLVRLQLVQCVGRISRADFPDKWPEFVDKLRYFLLNSNRYSHEPGLLCMYQLVKSYEFKKLDEKDSICNAMSKLLPVVYNLCVQSLPDKHESSSRMIKHILKIFFSFTEYTLPLDLITKDVFSQWMEICRAVIAKPVPGETLDTTQEVESCQMRWKCKKWAFRIMHRMFKRYGSPGSVTKEYESFSKWFLKTFSSGIIETSLKVLDEYRRKVYVSPRVLHIALHCINRGIGLSFSWKLLKPHMFAIIRDVVYPILSFDDNDEKLWQTNPCDYVKVKFDLFADFVSPVSAAQSLLRSATSKRKDMLQKTMCFLMQVLAWPSSTARDRDGALHMLGTLARILNKKKVYKSEIESILVQHVFPEFSSPFGHLRVRAFWCMHYFSSVKMKDKVLEEAIRLATQLLLEDKNIPVKVEAVDALLSLLTNQPRAKMLIQPNAKPIALQLLFLIHETGEDFLTSLLQKIVCTYKEELIPIAVDMCKNLSTTFNKFLQTGESYTYMLITLDSLLTAMQGNSEIMAQLQPIVLQIVVEILEKNISALYEEAMTLIYDLTCRMITPPLWLVLELIYKVFESGSSDYFMDMMPALHNYVTVDTEKFLSTERHMLIMYDMCKTILNSDNGVDSECHAAKLLEVIILQCKGKIDQCIPILVELVVQRLMRQMVSAELRTMCLQVIIAAFYYNFTLTSEVLEKIPASEITGESVSSMFIRQWIFDTNHFLGLHDRKLCILGLCQLMSITPTRPQILTDLAEKIVPALLELFNGLLKGYALRARKENEDETEEASDCDQLQHALSDEEDDFQVTGVMKKRFSNTRALSKLVDQAKNKIEVLSSDEDESCESGAEYLDYIRHKNIRGCSKFDENFTDEDDGEGEFAETELESYTTPLDAGDCEYDEYIIFKEVLQNIQTIDSAWYELLTGNLNAGQMTSLQEVISLAEQKKAAAESKKIEKMGGYTFTTQTVPTSFNFNRQY